VALALVTYVALYNATLSATSVYAVAAGYLAALVFLFAPAALGAWCARAVRQGRLRRGRLIEKSNGKWVMSVPHAQGPFDAAFEPPDWATDLPTGSDLLAVVSVRKPKVLLFLGPV
jgi:hypothetical protein